MLAFVPFESLVLATACEAALFFALPLDAQGKELAL
jgi:hypothetical protein